jgi:hypothetical protein
MERFRKHNDLYRVESNLILCVEDGVLAVPHAHPVRGVHVHPPPPPSPSPRLLLR